MIGSVADPVLDRRVRIAKFVRLAKKIGYGLFLLAVILFFVGFITQFSGELTGVIIASLVAGSLVLAPAIVFGYAVRSAHREDHEMGRL